MAAGARFCVAVKVLIGFTLCISCQGFGTHYNIILKRRDPTVALLGDILHLDLGLPAIGSPLAALQRTFLGKFVPLEVFRVNMTALTPERLCSYLTQLNPGMHFCEPDANVTLDAPSASPNDPLFSYQTDMQSIGMPAAWKTGELGSGQVKVCIVDTGIAYNHPDLAPNVWVNTKEMNGPGANAANGYKNGIDDDGDGIVDNIYGANFNSDPPNGDVMDQHGHGTHVSGIIGAVGNNGIGISGVNQAVSLMACRFMNADGNGSREQAIKCMDWCVRQDAHVLSNSWGEVPDSQSLQIAKLVACRFMDAHGTGSISKAIACVDWCMRRGVHAISNSYGTYDRLSGMGMKTAVAAVAARGALFVSSAGNDHNDNDADPHWPSNIETDTTMSVAALDRTGQLWAQSNFGNTTVDLCAPGENIMSTYIGQDGQYGQYTQLSGTSVAVPHVTGTAALMLAQLLQNGFNISTVAPKKGFGATIKKMILATVDPRAGGYVSHGALNTAAALAKAAAMKPSQAYVDGTGADNAVTETGAPSPGVFPDMSTIIGAIRSIGTAGNNPDGPATLDGTPSGTGQGSPAAAPSGLSTGSGSSSSSPAATSGFAAAVTSAAQSLANRIAGRNLRGIGMLTQQYEEAQPADSRQELPAQPLREGRLR